jgi:hypothetical protein
MTLFFCSSPDRRLDAALREAEAGSTVCPGCGFENFQRAIFCSICGQVVATLTKRQKKRMGNEVVLGNVRRQLRARTRKEWTRKIDVEGNLYWYRDSTPLSGPQYPGRVIRYVLKTSPSSLEVPTMQVLVNAASVTLETVASELRRDHAAHSVTMEDPTKDDPTAFFSVVSSDPDTEKHELRQLVEHAQRDFPSKLAEFVTHALSLFFDAEAMISVFTIHRSTLLEDSIRTLATLSPQQARAAIRVDFVGEQGIDAGGVYREWFLMANEEIVTPEAGVFVCVDQQDQTFYLNPRSRETLGENHLAHFLAAGRLLGRALLEGNVTGFHLALPLLKTILGQPVSFSDLEYFDPEAFKNLQWLLDNDNVDTLGLDFTVVEASAHGAPRTIELVANGSQIDVTDANKREFVDRKLQYLLVESVSAQLFAFLKGLYDVVPPAMLMLFDAEELDYVVSGSDEIDVDDWERHTKYSADLWSHPTRQWFWELVREMPNEYKRRLLQFATGSSRAPLSGFSALTSYDGRLCPFTLVGMPLFDEGFVRSHACFNRLDVPRHVNKAHLKKGLYALLETESYGFTTA